MSRVIGKPLESQKRLFDHLWYKNDPSSSSSKFDWTGRGLKTRSAESDLEGVLSTLQQKGRTLTKDEQVVTQAFLELGQRVDGNQYLK
ncbi:MAG TPA: hypothetical protein DHV51_05580, partial [Opitutae bacterium]|nr:hypothetical protein [Opitutae bacterium]